MEVRAVPTSYLLRGTWLHPHAVGLGRHILGGLGGESCPCPCARPWGQGCPYPYSEVRTIPCTKSAYGLLDGVGLWPPF